MSTITGKNYITYKHGTIMKQLVVGEFLHALALSPITLNIFIRRLGPLPPPHPQLLMIMFRGYKWTGKGRYRTREVTDRKWHELLGK